MATECETSLAKFKAALDALDLGEQVVSVSRNGTTVSYTPATRETLVKRIQELQVECGTSVNSNGLSNSRRGPIMFRG